MCFFILEICDCFSRPGRLVFDLSVAFLNFLFFLIKYHLVLCIVVTFSSIEGINYLLSSFAFLFYFTDKNFVLFLESLILFIINKHLMLSEATDFDCWVSFTS